MDTNLSDKGMRLLKKGKRGILRVVFSRLGLFVVLLLIQLFIPLALANWCSQYMPHYLSLNAVFIFVMVLYLLNSSFDPTAKITWLILIMMAPFLNQYQECEFSLYTSKDSIKYACFFRRFSGILSFFKKKWISLFYGCIIFQLKKIVIEI